jgi:hypothetical protein
MLNQTQSLFSINELREMAFQFSDVERIGEKVVIFYFEILCLYVRRRSSVK